ncbi:MAG: hypothetical protein ACI4Q3_08645 [Kiritimatiellia bacterium]
MDKRKAAQLYHLPGSEINSIKNTMSRPGNPKQRYEDFVEKFKAKLTTDDCYTPLLVYEVVFGWRREKYAILARARACESGSGRRDGPRADGHRQGPRRRIRAEPALLQDRSTEQPGEACRTA